MFEIIFLFFMALIWIIFATIQDLKTREIANWLNFSLIIFALGFRFFYSLSSSQGFGFFYQGLIGLGIFFVLGNMLYYGKMFAGGDAKLLIALGAVLPVADGFYSNLESFFLFMVLFLITGAFYSMVVSASLCIKNYSKFKREFSRQFKLNKKKMFLGILISITLVLLSYINYLFIFLAILSFILPYLYLYAKAIDETAMIKIIEPGKLREGDWLYKDIRIKGRTIRADWGGLNKQDIALLKRERRKIKIREGVVFTPVFLISFLIFFYLWVSGLRYPFW